MWLKTYTLSLNGAAVTPQQVVIAWRENFGSCWPKINRFYGSPGGIVPGQVAVLNLAGSYGMTAPGGRGQVIQINTLVDPRRQWSQAGLVWHNAVIRATLSAPFRWMRGFFKR